MPETITSYDPSTLEVVVALIPDTLGPNTAVFKTLKGIPSGRLMVILLWYVPPFGIEPMLIICLSATSLPKVLPFAKTVNA